MVEAYLFRVLLIADVTFYSYLPVWRRTGSDSKQCDYFSGFVAGSMVIIVIMGILY